MTDKLYFAAETDDIGQRLDVFLTDELESYSRSRIQKMIEAGEILVNETAAKSNYKLRKSDCLTVIINEPEELAAAAEDILLDVLYEDDQLIVINKPKGMVVHPAAGHFSGTLVNALLHHCRNSLSGINGVLRPGIVHRIDRDTSGALVCAKTDIAHHSLALQLSEHSIKRVYKCVCIGRLKENLIIDEPISRSERDRKKMAVVKGGKRAVTHLTVLEDFKGFSLLEARLETGRTHQIRVHLAHIKHPVLGDEVYGSKTPGFSTAGQCLHAETIGFIHPKTNEYVEFTAPLPDVFKIALEKLRK